jgi:hypothetical protein
VRCSERLGPFVHDYLQLVGQERSPELRSRLLSLAREWMQAAVHEHTATQPPRLRKFAPAIGRGDRVARGQIDQLGTPDLKEGVVLLALSNLPDLRSDTL